MPVTPFHFGPGALLKAIAPQSVSFSVFVAANVAIDVESAVNLIAGRSPVHATVHTLPVALAVGVLIGVAAAGLGRWRGWTSAEWSLRPALTGGALGGVGHSLLDGVMHADIRPFLPLTPENPLFRIVTLNVMHEACIVAGLLGVAGLLWRGWRANVAR